MTYITGILAREILDSRGIPTIETQVELSDGSCGRAAVPSGASTGRHEALELRDEDHQRFGGRGVLKAIANVKKYIEPALKGHSPFRQEHIDNRLIDLDGTPDKSRIGANAILGTSLAIAHAAAASKDLPLYQYLALGEDFTLPVPMFNILNGGVHVTDSVDVQEFMVIPAGLPTYRAALRAGAEIYYALKNILRRKNLSTAVGDEGGFAPSIASNRSALELVAEAIEAAGYEAGRECFIGIDVAASELLKDGKYYLARDGIALGPDKLVDFYQNWTREFGILSIEDGLGEDDWEGWQILSEGLRDRVQLVGDDLYTTNTQRISKGIELRASNAVLLKLNQIGTLTETVEAFSLAQRAGWGTIISHRSGETEDTTIADLAVALNAGQIKAGAPCRSERVAKYNRLLRIEEEMGARARYAGMETYRHLSLGR